MSKLIMFSSFQPFLKTPALSALKKLPELTGKRSNRIAFIPYWDEIDDEYLTSVIIKDCFFKILEIGSVEIFWAKKDSLDNYDAVWLPGGNTFEALKYLKDTGIFDILKKFQGVFIGVSAGSIIMTPTIKIAQFADDNPDEDNDLEALNFTNFEVKPHWNSWRNKKQIFRDYTLLHRRAVIGIPEGSAILVNGADLEAFGEYEIIS